MTHGPHSPPPKTLADLLTVVQHSAQLSERRRRDILTAIHTIARLLQRVPSQLPAEPRLLARRLEEVAPAAHGLNPRTFSNVRSLLGAAFAQCRAMAPGRHTQPLSPSWQQLWNAIESRSLRALLSRFMHHCSVAAIQPGDVTDAVFESFAHGLQDSLLKNPTGIARDARNAWNRACRECPNWPDRPVAQARWISEILKWDAFPKSFAEDAQKYLDRLARPQLTEDLPFRPVKASTITARDRQLRAFASALVRCGRDPATLHFLADLVEISAFKRGLEFFLQRREGRSSSAIADLVATLVAVARHWARVPSAELDRLTAIQRRLEVRTRVMTESVRVRLRQFNDSGNVEKLVDLPAKMAADAERIRVKKSFAAALNFQTAVAIDILLMAPMRIGNLVALDLNKNLIRHGTSLHLVIEVDATKNREEMDFPMPKTTVALIDRYLAVYRPVLAQSGNAWLFPGDGLVHKRRAQVGKKISQSIFAGTGLRVNPQLFRHIAAKLYLDAHPGEYEVVRRLLGHKSIETTIRFYTGLESAAAARRYDAVILAHRAAGARPT